MGIDYKALQTELASPAYTGLTDTAILAALQVKTVAARRPIPADEVSQYFVRTGIAAAAAFFLLDPTKPPDQWIACKTLRDAIENSFFTSFDLDDPNDKTPIDQYIGSLITAGVMTAAQQTALYALADIKMPFAQSIGASRDLDVGDLKQARALGVVV